MDMDWKMVLANAAANAAPVLAFAVAYAIREWANSLSRKKSDEAAQEDRKRLENKMDGNTALTATQLVSSGNLPKSAPCIPAVATALSKRTGGNGVEACEYASTAKEAAHEAMEHAGIPINSQDVLVAKLRAVIADSTAIEKIEDIRIKEERHAANNTAWILTLKEEIDRLNKRLDGQLPGSDTLNPQETLPLRGTK